MPLIMSTGTSYYQCAVRNCRLKKISPSQLTDDYDARRKQQPGLRAVQRARRGGVPRRILARLQLDGELFLLTFPLIELQGGLISQSSESSCATSEWAVILEKPVQTP